jgi:hypothetical protein
MSVNWIETAQYDQIKEIVVRAFNLLEWEGLTTYSTTSAKKSFKTLAGENECLVYLEGYNSDNCRLKAEFITEGNDILSTFTGTINKQSNEADVNHAVSAFVGIITARINECRMVRLVKSNSAAQ